VKVSLIMEFSFLNADDVTIYLFATLDHVEHGDNVTETSNIPRNHFHWSSSKDVNRSHGVTSGNP